MAKTPSPAFLCSQILPYAALTASSRLYRRGVITVPFSARSVVGQSQAQAGSSACCTLCWMDETWHFQLGHSHKAWLAVALPCSPAPRAAGSDSAARRARQLQGKDCAPCPVLQCNYHWKIYTCFFGMHSLPHSLPQGSEEQDFCITYRAGGGCWFLPG